jgi:hypothetical protein
MLEGKMNMVLGDVTKVIGTGDLVHIPRNTLHGIKVVEGPAVFFACKSPVGTGQLSQDYNKAPNAKELQDRLDRTGKVETEQKNGGTAPAIAYTNGGL